MPEPQAPIIKGSISGLREGYFATIMARLDSAREGGIIGFGEKGSWEMDVIYAMMRNEGNLATKGYEGTRRFFISHELTRIDTNFISHERLRRNTKVFY